VDIHWRENFEFYVCQTSLVLSNNNRRLVLFDDNFELSIELA